MTKLGLLTIGQAPRDDITPDIKAQLPEHVEVIEAGALDRFDSAKEIEEAAGAHDGEPVFVTKLRDGSSVTIDRAATIGLMQERIQELAADVSTIGVLCTGAFPTFNVDVPVLEPSKLLHAWTSGIVDDGTVGVLVPEPEQVLQTRKKWAEFDLVTASGSPYVDEDEVSPAAEALGTDVDLVVMDCMGYTPEMKDQVRTTTGAGVLLGRSVLWKTSTEVL
ncbi:AroM family protein [Halorubrum rutilum]|uniref:AroM family protein n=1 Tax=Halorubrum rutilum TaxID=1364933 RepID=A0ABD6APP4_9EURY|nr:AroM family protein [Halorubrum rutilum]